MFIKSYNLIEIKKFYDKEGDLKNVKVQIFDGAMPTWSKKDRNRIFCKLMTDFYNLESLLYKNKKNMTIDLSIPSCIMTFEEESLDIEHYYEFIRPQKLEKRLSVLLNYTTEIFVTNTSA